MSFTSTLIPVDGESQACADLTPSPTYPPDWVSTEAPDYVNWTDTDSWIVFYWILLVGCIVLIVLQSIGLCYNASRLKAEDRMQYVSKNGSSRIILATLFITYACCTLGVLLALARFNQWPNADSCTHAYQVAYALYVIMKAANYFFFLQRARLAQGLTIQERHFTRTIPGAILFCLVVQLLMIAFIQVTGCAVKSTRTGRNLCVVGSTYNGWHYALFAVQTIVDLSASAFFLYLFGKPLFKLYKKKTEGSTRNLLTDKKLIRTIYINFVFTTLSSVNTALVQCLFFWVSFFSYWWIADYFFNGLCMFCMFASNRRLLMHMCCCCNLKPNDDTTESNQDVKIGLNPSLHTSRHSREKHQLSPLSALSNNLTANNSRNNSFNYPSKSYKSNSPGPMRPSGIKQIKYNNNSNNASKRAPDLTPAPSEANPKQNLNLQLSQMTGSAGSVGSVGSAANTGANASKSSNNANKGGMTNDLGLVNTFDGSVVSAVPSVSYDGSPAAQPMQPDQSASNIPNIANLPNIITVPPQNLTQIEELRPGSQAVSTIQTVQIVGTQDAQDTQEAMESQETRPPPPPQKKVEYQESVELVASPQKANVMGTPSPLTLSKQPQAASSSLRKLDLSNLSNVGGRVKNGAENSCLGTPQVHARTGSNVELSAMSAQERKVWRHEQELNEMMAYLERGVLYYKFRLFWTWAMWSFCCPKFYLCAGCRCGSHAQQKVYERVYQRDKELKLLFNAAEALQLRQYHKTRVMLEGSRMGSVGGGHFDARDGGERGERHRKRSSGTVTGLNFSKRLSGTKTQIAGKMNYTVGNTGIAGTAGSAGSGGSAESAGSAGHRRKENVLHSADASQSVTVTVTALGVEGKDLGAYQRSVASDVRTEQGKDDEQALDAVMEEVGGMDDIVEELDNDHEGIRMKYAGGRSYSPSNNLNSGNATDVSDEFGDGVDKINSVGGGNVMRDTKLSSVDSDQTDQTNESNDN